MTNNRQMTNNSPGMWTTNDKGNGAQTTCNVLLDPGMLTLFYIYISKFLFILGTTTNDRGIGLPSIALLQQNGTKMTPSPGSPTDKEVFFIFIYQ